MTVLPLAQELAEVTRLLADDDLPTAFTRFTDRVKDTVPGCAAALITVRVRGRLENIAGKAAVDLTAPGPVVESLAFGEPRRLDDVATDQRWPAFSADLAGAGYRSCVVLPIPVSADTSAVFTLLSSEPEAFGEITHDIVLLLVLYAGVVFDNVSLYQDSTRLIDQLRTALVTRTTVGQAQGLLMRHYGYDADRAFLALRTASQNSNTKLRDVAALIVGAHSAGEFEGTLHRLALSAAGESVGTEAG